MRIIACALSIAIGAAAWVREQPDHAASAVDLRGQLAAARAEPGRAESSDELLRQLIKRAPEDPEAPTWMIDRAELALQRAAKDGAVSSLMFGVPARTQPVWVSRHATAAAELCGQARAAIDAAVARLEGELLVPGADAEQARETAARVEPLLAMLIEAEQAVRLPEIEFAAAALRALCDPLHEPREQALRDALARLGGGSRDALRSPRTALLGAALLLRSDDAPARDAASRLLDQLVRAHARSRPDESERPLAPGDAVRLCMALIVCGREADAAQVPCPGRGEDWLVDLLLAEANARALMRGTPRHGEVATEGAVRAAGHLLSIAERYDGGPAALDTPAGPGPLRQLIYEKAAVLLPPGAPWGAIDAELALARAWALLSPRDATPQSVHPPSAECQALLESVGARNDAHEAVRAQARWLLANEHQDRISPSSAAASRALAQIVLELPRTRLARGAAERIVRDHAPDLSGLDAQFESVHQAAVVASALRLLVAADDPPQDATLARLAVALVGHDGVCGDTWTEAVAACQRIGAADQRERIARLLTSRIDPMLHATQPVQERIDALAAAAKWLDARGEAWRSQELRLQRVELIIDSGTSHDARAEIEALIGSAMDRAGTVERARLRTVRGIMLRRAGDVAGAMTEFRTVASEFERDSRSSDAARAPARQAFWCAWAEMLEIAACAGDAPERAEQARQQRQRLELLDPSLGGEPWAGRIRAATGSQSK